MPLVIPGLTSSNGGDAKSEWMNKLMGKKLTESTTDHQSFSKQELPQNHRVLEPGSMSTADHNPERLNVHVDGDGNVKDVKFG